MSEALGITVSPDQFHYAGAFRIQYEKVFHGRLFRDNEVTRIYVYQEPVNTESLVLQTSEVSEVRWFELEEVWEEIQRGDRSRFCVPTAGLRVLLKYLGEMD